MSGTTQAKRVEAAIRDRVEGVIEAEGFELVHVEFVVDRGRNIARLFIDTIPPGTEGHGVTIDDCTRVSRWVSDVLDVEDVVPGEYNLEVSSPGIFRPLTKPVHYARHQGARIKVKTYEKVEGRKTFTGTLLARTEESISVRIDDGTTFEIPLQAVAKANLEPLLD